MTEWVLAFPAGLLDDWYHEFEIGGGILRSPLLVYQLIQEVLSSERLCYVERVRAETDPGLKQVIPYVAFVRREQYFVYQRTIKGGEGRLHGLYSIGVGGHINPCDGEADDGLVYWKGFSREIQEEVSLTRRGNEFYPIAAAIYDPSNDVGRVHFGVVHLYHVDDSTEFTFTDPSLNQGRWVDRKWLSDNYMSFENWSKLVITGVL